SCKREDCRQEVLARLKVGDFAAVKPDFHRATAINIALHPAEGALGIIEVMLENLLSKPPLAVGGLVDDRWHNGDAFSGSVAPAIGDESTVVGQVQGYCLMPGLIP